MNTYVYYTLNPNLLTFFSSAGSGSSVRSSGNQISVQEMRAKKKAEAEAVAKEVEAINQLEETKKEIQQRLSSFDHITENKFVCER